MGKKKRKIFLFPSYFPCGMEPDSSSSSEADQEVVTPEDLLRLATATEKMRITIDDTDAIKKRSKYIPLRLKEEERKLFQMLQGALEVSE